MPGPSYVLRDYAGGVVEGVQLTAAIGATDLAFTIANTTGWVDAANNPLGTAGPFTVVIDLGTPTAEKILCSLVNLTSGLVTVYTSSGFSGRGYDQSTAQAHVPGGSAVGVVPAWSAVEAAEANKAVYELLGGGNLPGSAGGRCYAASGATVTGSPTVSLTTQSYVKGGVTFQTTTGNSGLVVPVTGSYILAGQVSIQASGASSNLTAFIAKNSGATILTYGDEPGTPSEGAQASVVSDIRELTVGDVVNLGYAGAASDGIPFEVGSNASTNYLAIALLATG